MATKIKSFNVAEIKIGLTYKCRRNGESKDDKWIVLDHVIK